MPNDYLPSSDDALSVWAQNFKAKIGANATAMGWPGDMQDALESQSTSISSAVLAKETALTAYRQAVEAADTTLMTAKAYIRQQVGAGKKSATYTEAAGEALGVIGGGGDFDPATYQAKVKSVRLIGAARVSVGFVRGFEQVKGMRLFSRLQGQSAWRTVETATSSPIVDATPLAQPGVPEVREYRVRGVVRNEEIGAPSDPVIVTVT